MWVKPEARKPPFWGVKARLTVMDVTLFAFLFLLPVGEGERCCYPKHIGQYCQ